MTHAATQTALTPPAPDSDIEARAGRRVHSEAAWASARDAYLAGEAGASAAARHGISDSAFWRRAAEEGWRRRDQPDDPPAPFDPDRPALDDEAQLALIDRRASWALQRGDAGEALRWLRMRDRIELRGHRLREAQARAEAAAVRRSQREATADIQSVAALARGVEQVAKAELAGVRAQMRRHGLERAMSRRESGESKIQTPVPPTDPPAPLDPDAPGLSRAERRRRLKYRARRAGAADP